MNLFLRNITRFRSVFCTSFLFIGSCSGNTFDPKPKAEVQTINWQGDYIVEQLSANIFGISRLGKAATITHDSLIELMSQDYCKAECIYTIAKIIDEDGVTSLTAIADYLAEKSKQKSSDWFTVRSADDSLVRKFAELLNRLPRAKIAHGATVESWLAEFEPGLLSRLGLQEDEVSKIILDSWEEVSQSDPNAFSLYIAVASLVASKKCSIVSWKMEEMYTPIETSTRAIAWDPKITGSTSGTSIVTDSNDVSHSVPWSANHLKKMSVMDWMIGKENHKGLLLQLASSGVCE